MKIILCIALFAVSTPSFALGKLGHKLVCAAAYMQLSIEQQNSVDRILKNVSSDDIQAINKYLGHPLASKLTFSKACTWADVIKNKRKFKQFKSWHFINVNRNTSRVSNANCRNQCITSAIKFHQNQLQNDNSFKNKAQALMFLGHWIGDIHQPLHVSYASDLGGNQVSVIPFRGSCDNLHWYWDQCLLYPSVNDKGARLQYWLPKINAQLTNQNVKAWQSSNIYLWADESLTLVKEASFGYCQLTSKGCISTNKSTLVIDERYHQYYQEILLTRIAQASTRLAFILSKSLN